MLVDSEMDIADLYGIKSFVKKTVGGAGKVAKGVVTAPTKVVTTAVQVAKSLPTVAAKTGAFVGKTAAGAVALPVTTAISLTKAAGETLGRQVVAPLVKAPFQIIGATGKAIFKGAGGGGGAGAPGTTAQDEAVELVRSGQVPVPQPTAISPEVQAAAAEAAQRMGASPPQQQLPPLIPPPGVGVSSAPLTMDPETGAPGPPAPQGFFANLPMAVKIGLPVVALGGLYYFFRKRSGGRRTKS